jgi:hypothetical protein
LHPEDDAGRGDHYTFESSAAPPTIAIDGGDNLYTTDEGHGVGGFVWKRSPSGAVEKIAGQAGQDVTLNDPRALAFDGTGNLLIADYLGILRLNPDGPWSAWLTTVGSGRAGSRRALMAASTSSETRTTFGDGAQRRA